MAKKRDFSQSNNFLALLGRPVFNSLVLLISFLSFLILFLDRFIRTSQFRLQKSITKIRLPVFRLPHFSIPKFSISFPKTNFSLPRRPSTPKAKRPVLSFPRVSQIKLSTLLLRFNYRRLIFPLAVIGLVTFIYFEFFYNLPDPRILSQFPSKLTTQILDRHGNLLYKIYKDENRTLINLDTLPPHVKNAFLAAEDKDFYSHQGFSLPGLFRALYKNLFDDKLEGGSTITQQLIKNTILTSEKTLSRKIKELILAIQAEHLFSKDKIFEMYLNQVGFGGPAYGIQEAARQYFDVDAKDLDLAQSAYLAGLTRAPSKYSPFGDHPELAIGRQQLVLRQMVTDGFISQDEIEKALQQKLTFKSAKIEIKAPHFVMLIKNILVEQLGENVVTQGGLKVYTTLDSDLQDMAQKVVTEEIKKLHSFNVTNGSALITNPHTGEILAMVGSKDYFNLNENGQVNLTMALRQPGSAIKPLNYALSFENGKSPATIIEDKPVSFHLPGQQSWAPKNYDGRFHGFVTFRQALASSYNIPSVLLLAQNGIDNFANFAKKMGITTWDNPSRFGLSMALGSLEVRMVDLATAYSAFANQGIVTPLNSIVRIEKTDGKNLLLSSCPNPIKNSAVNSVANAEDNSCAVSRVISPTTAYLISDILSDNSARSPAFGANSILNITSAKVSVKTGTSNDLKDNWTIGYTKDFLVATWVGNNDNTPMSRVASGITGASPIWTKIFNNILEKNPEPKTLTPPDNLIKVAICTLTGTLTCAGCPTRTDYFVKGTEPTKACDPIDIQNRLNPTPTQPISSKPQIL
jgi:1A family penicillin-binding protein